MTQIKPRRFALRGVVKAHGFILYENVLDIDELRLRALQLWTPGTVIYKCLEGLIVIRPTELLTHCWNAPGAPLVELKTADWPEAPKNVLLSLPLEKDELLKLNPLPDSIVFTRNGKLINLPLHSLEPEDAGKWINLADFKVVNTHSLGEPPARPEFAAKTPFDDLRKHMGGHVPPQDPEAVEIMALLKKGSSSAGRRNSKWSGVGGKVLSAVASGIMGLLGQWAGSASNGTGGSRGGNGRGRASKASPATAPGNNTPSPLSAWLRDKLAKALVFSRLFSILGRRQAQYFSKMIDMFESGDIQEALRRAVPLSTSGSDSASPAFGLPSARSELKISPYSGGASASYLSADLYENLRKVYRKAFERMEREGRFEEAAFILAELLHAEEEAVNFLEKHGRKQLAAEIAEARGLAPGLAVRQWFVAGNAERAVQVARRTGSFADAVFRLERTDKNQAAALRVLWAKVLAESGDFAAAVRAIWPIKQARAKTVDWIRRGMDAGGPLAAALLAYKAAGFPDKYAETLGEAKQLMENDSEDELPARNAFAETLSSMDAGPEVSALARLAFRSQIRDSVFQRKDHVLKKLESLASDGALSNYYTIIKPRLSPQTKTGAAPFEQVTIQSNDKGTCAVYDAAYLPNGKLLVALGEAGAQLLNRDGRVIAAFDQPSHKLVVSDSGTRAIALAKRGETLRLSRFDLVLKRASFWCDARISCFASTYDGSLWFAADGEALLAIDALKDKFTALWKTSRTGGPVLAVERSLTSCSFIVGGDISQCWRLELPSLILRARQDLIFSESTIGLPGISSEGQTALIEKSVEPRLGEPVVGKTIKLMQGKNILGKMPLTEDGSVALTPKLSGPRIALPMIKKGASEVRLFVLRQGKFFHIKTIVLEGTGNPSVRLNNLSLVVSDDLGRVIVLDAGSGRTARNFRI